MGAKFAWVFKHLLQFRLVDVFVGLNFVRIRVYTDVSGHEKNIIHFSELQGQKE